MFNDVVIGFERNYMDGDPPKIGDNVYFGPGVKIFGPITIADNIAIGANAIVNKSFTEPGITIAGIPAKKVSDNGSGRLVIKATELVDINNYSVKND
jgi:serine O-acetyltransferase